MQKTLQENNFSKAMIGLSGGVDSAVTLTLCVNSLGKENVYAALLPCGNLNKKGGLLAKKIIRKNKLPEKNIFDINIQEPIALLLKKLPQTDRVRRGNIIARVRMTILFDLAKKLGALVVGTENKSEHLLGYFTRFGDESSDIELIRNLYKTEVYRLAKQLEIPPEIIKSFPTAGLWNGQTDEGELGFSYSEADPILYFLYEKREPLAKIIKRGFSRDLILKVKGRVEINIFKQETPYVFSVNSS